MPPSAAGLPYNGVQVGADRTAYQTTVTGTSRRKVTAVHPDGTTTTSAPITGYPNGAVQVGADGTGAQTIQTGDSTSGCTTKVAVVHPDGTTTTAPPITGYPSGAVQVGADGTVAQTIPTGVSTGTVMVVRPDGTTTNVLVGDTWGPRGRRRRDRLPNLPVRGTPRRCLLSVLMAPRTPAPPSWPLPMAGCGSAPMGPPIKPFQGNSPAATSRR